MFTTLALVLALSTTPAHADVVIYLGAPPPHHQGQQHPGWVWVPRHRAHHGHWVSGHWARVPAHPPRQQQHHRRRRR